MTKAIREDYGSVEPKFNLRSILLIILFFLCTINPFPNSYRKPHPMRSQPGSSFLSTSLRVPIPIVMRQIWGDAGSS